MVILSILGYFLLGLGALLTAILFVPYHYHVSGDKLDQIQIKSVISWLFGGVKIKFRQHANQTEVDLIILGLTKQVKVGKKSPNVNNKKNTERNEIVKTAKPKQGFKFTRYLKTDVIERALSIVIKIIKHCQPKVLSIKARISFDDPLYTGLLWAFNSQFYGLFNKYDINIKPVFDEDVLAGSFLIGGRIWLPYLILVMIGFLITKPIRNILISQLKMKIKGGIQYVR